MVVQHRKEERMTGYDSMWNKDSAKDTAEHVKSRVENYTELVNGEQNPSYLLLIIGYYDGATELYEYGWGESFHFCRFYKGEAFQQGVSVDSDTADFSLHDRSTISPHKWASSLE